MNHLTDQQLVREFAEHRSEAAFAEIVRRHVNLVYSAALRMVRDAHLAEDVSQGVFTALAGSAPQLTNRPVLSGWLHRTARNLAANVVRSDVRRRTREQEAAVMNELQNTGPEVAWEQIALHLDAALGELNEADRDVVLLRYFENKSASEMAGILGISDDAAQKRVSRAVDRLREFFSKKKVTIGASGLAVLISANAVQSAPAGLAIAISSAALAGTAVSTSTVIVATTKTLAMTALQKTLVTATVAVLAGTGIYEARQAAQLREQNQTLQQQQAPLVEQIQQLQNSFADATNRLVELLVENSRLKSNPYEMELLKLRGETGTLRQRNERLAQALQKAEKQDHPAFPTNFVSRDSWSFVGYGTPEDALKTALWAKSVGNEQAYLNAMSPEMTNGAVQGNTDEERSQFLMDQMKNITGYHILSEIRIADDEVLLQAEANGHVNEQSNLVVMAVMKQTESGWKEFDEYQGVGGFPSGSNRKFGK